MTLRRIAFRWIESSCCPSCAWPDEATSARVALFLGEQGYGARALTGGYDGWREAGLPLEPLAPAASGTTA